jgi:hypothetical protein
MTGVHEIATDLTVFYNDRQRYFPSALPQTTVILNGNAKDFGFGPNATVTRQAIAPQPSYCTSDAQLTSQPNNFANTTRRPSH